MIPEKAKNLFVSKFSIIGEDKFYEFILEYANNKIIEEGKKIKGNSPEIELIDYSDKFIALFRTEGNKQYLDIARVFRRAAHRIYFLLLKKAILKRKNGRFLNVVGVVVGGVK
jgi:hypothetical protein